MKKLNDISKVISDLDLLKPPIENLIQKTDKTIADDDIYRSKNELFLQAVDLGNKLVANQLIETTPDKEEQQLMIHGGKEAAFLTSARHKDPLMMNYIIELTPDTEQKDAMIHSCKNQAFTMALFEENSETLKFLIALTPNQEKQKEMVNTLWEKVGEFEDKKELKNIFTHLAVISTNDDIFRNPEKSGPLNEEKIIKLKELRDILSDELQGDSSIQGSKYNQVLASSGLSSSSQDNLLTDSVKFEEFKTAAKSNANLVIATLLAGDNLIKTRDFFDFQKKSYGSEDKRLNDGVWSEIASFAPPVHFSNLSEVENEKVLNKIKDFFLKPQLKKDGEAAVSLTPSTVIEIPSDDPAHQLQNSPSNSR